MTAAPTENRPGPLRHPLLGYSALIALGLAGNYLKFTIFLDIDVLFGSIFAMLALQFFGPARGVLAAAVIAGYTFFLWNHPYAIVIMTAEVAVVALLMRRHRLGLVLADTLYWLFLGIPLVWLCYHGLMQVPFENCLITMTKQAMNGISNALAARLLFSLYLLRSRSEPISYQDILYNLLAFFVLCPALILLGVGSRDDFAQADGRIRSLLMHESRQVAGSLEAWIDNRKSAVLSLAQMSATKSPRQVQPFLELVKEADANFRRIGLLDRDAVVTAYIPLLDEAGERNIGKNFADRPFIAQARRTLKPVLSGVVLGRAGNPAPFVALVVPVVKKGAYCGHVTGILNLDRIRTELEGGVARNGLLYTLVDGDGKVIMSSRGDQAVLKPFLRPRGTLVRLDNWVDQWVPFAPANLPVSQRWKNSFYVTEIGVGTPAQWKLILEQPVAPFQKMLSDNYSAKLMLLFLILLGALALAEVISRALIAALGELSTLTRGLPDRLAVTGEVVSWPKSCLEETRNLIDNFQGMANSLSGQFSQVRLLNDSLEQRVRQRTQALRESEAFTVDVINSLTSNIAVLDAEGVIVSVNEPWLSFAALNGAEVAGSSFVGTEYLAAGRDCGDPLSLAAAGGIREVLRGERDDFSLEYPCHYGETERWFVLKVSRLKGTRGGAVVSHSEITTRKLVEAALRGNQALLDSIVNGTSDAIFVKDLLGRYLLFNAAAQHVVGKSAAEVCCNDDFALFPREEAQAIREGDRKVLEAGRLGSVEDVVTDAAGERRTFLATKGPLFDAGGKIIGLFGISRDITERKQLEDRVRQALEEAKATNATMSRLLNTVAHEFRTPLGLLAGSTDILDRYWDRLSLEQRREQNERIRSAARQLTVLINSVASFRPTGEESRPGTRSLVEVGDACRVVAAEVEQVWGMGQKFEVEIAEDCGSVLLDEVHFRRVLENLLTNAFRYTPPPGSVSLTVSRAEGSLLLQVADTGIGIPEEDRDRIFQAFYRSGNVEGRRGLGLGLSLVRDSLSQLGGSIAVGGSLGAGTVMKVEIPVGEPG